MTYRQEPNWVLVPGTLCSAGVFDPVMTHLDVPATRRRVLMADAPFAGDYAARLEVAVAPGDIACGFSLGSLVLAHNLNALKKARAVVLLSLNPLSDPPANGAIRRSTRDRIASGDARGWVAENWSKMSVRHDPELLTTVADMAVDTSPLIGPQTELAMSRPDATEVLRNADMPIVFVTGAEDQMTPPGPIVEIGAGARNAHVEVIPGLGHFALLEAPDRIAAAISRGLSAVLKDELHVNG